MMLEPNSKKARFEDPVGANMNTSYQFKFYFNFFFLFLIDQRIDTIGFLNFILGSRQLGKLIPRAVLADEYTRRFETGHQKHNAFYLNDV